MLNVSKKKCVGLGESVEHFSLACARAYHFIGASLFLQLPLGISIKKSTYSMRRQFKCVFHISTICLKLFITWNVHCLRYRVAIIQHEYVYYVHHYYYCICFLTLFCFFSFFSSFSWIYPIAFIKHI